MHDLALHAWSTLHHATLIAAPSAPSSGGDNNTVKVAIVTAIGLVVATAITAIASTLKRSTPTPAPTGGGVSQNEVFTKQYIRSLETDRRELGKLRTSHAHLREACRERGLDPDDMIREQETP